MNRKAVEEKARAIATRVFNDGTMRTMLYELIAEAFGAPQVSAREVTPPVKPNESAGQDDCG